MGTPHPCIEGAPLKKFFMGPLRNNAPIINHTDVVRRDDRRQAVCNDNERLSFRETGDRTLDVCFVLGVCKGRGLVEHHNGCVLQDRTGDADALTLPAGKCVTRLSRRRIPTVRQAVDELVAACRGRRRAHLIVRSTGLT